MDLTPYVDTVRHELAVAAEAGGDDARALAERLAATLASAIRLTLLDALSAAADEITRELAPGSVEVRLRGGDPTFAVSVPAAEAPDREQAYVPAAEPPADDDGAMTRINLRLSEQLKGLVEEAAGLTGRSVNAWIVRTVSAALQPQTQPPPTARPGRSAQRYTGWVQ